MRRELDRLLAEPAETARNRGRTLWERLWRPGTPLVLHGAGNVGRIALARLRAEGIEPVAFADGDPRKRGTRVDDLPVFAPAQAMAAWGRDALFLVTILNRDHSYAATAETYAGLGASRIAPVLAYFWSRPEGVLPYFAMAPPETVIEARETVQSAFSALGDAASRAHFLAYLRWRLHLDYAALPGPCPEQQFFPQDLISLGEQETFVD
jgi:hypothetical protein